MSELIKLQLLKTDIEILVDLCKHNYNETFLLSIEDKLHAKTGATVCAFLKQLKEKLESSIK